MIFLDTNVISENMRRLPDAAVLAWLDHHDAEIALSTVVIGEVAFGIAKIPEAERSKRLEQGLSEWRNRFADRIYDFTENAALAYGELMGQASLRGRLMSAPDGMIAAVAKVNGGRLATRNIKDFEGSGVTLINPWEF